MNNTFVHHVPFSAAGETAAEAERVTLLNAALRMAGRTEVAIIPPDSPLLAGAPLSPSASNAAWSAIRESTNLQWVVASREPSKSRTFLPADWSADSYRHVCLAAIIDEPGSFSPKAAELRALPTHRRALLLRDSAAIPDDSDALVGMDWLVVDELRQDEDGDMIAELSEAAAIASFIVAPSSEAGADNADPVGKSDQRQNHPFGRGIELSRLSLDGHVETNLRAKVHLALWGKEPAAPETAENAKSADLTMQDSDSTRSASEPHPSKGRARTDLCLDPVHSGPSSEIGAKEEFDRLDRIVRRGAEAFKEVGKALVEIRSAKLWRSGGFATWEDYLKSALGMSRSYASRIIRASRFASELEMLPNGNITTSVAPLSEAQLRPLNGLKGQEQRAEAWTRSVEQAGANPTAEVVGAVVAEMRSGSSQPQSSRGGKKARIIEAFMSLRRAATNGAELEQLDREFDALGKLLGIPTG